MNKPVAPKHSGWSIMQGIKKAADPFGSAAFADEQSV
jgi:hypothetical protein